MIESLKHIFQLAHIGDIMAKRKSQGKRPANAPVNFVHVHGLTFNKGAQHADRRAESKRGKRKHKAAWDDSPAALPFYDASYITLQAAA
jgi:hypothetical protein